MQKAVAIPSNSELMIVPADWIVLAKAAHNYITLTLTDGQQYIITMNLRHFQQLIEDQLKEEAEMFIRIGKSLIINRNYIFSIRPGKQQIILAFDMAKSKVTENASSEALKEIKQLIESELC